MFFFPFEYTFLGMYTGECDDGYCGDGGDDGGGDDGNDGVCLCHRSCWQFLVILFCFILYL